MKLFAVLFISALLGSSYGIRIPDKFGDGYKFVFGLCPIQWTRNGEPHPLYVKCFEDAAGCTRDDVAKHFPENPDEYWNALIGRSVWPVAPRQCCWWDTSKSFDAVCPDA